MGLFSPNTAKYFKRVNVPTVEEMSIFLQNMVQQGVITPQEAQTYQQDPSSFLDIVEDPATRRAQMDVMGGMQETIDAGGLDAQAQASLAQAQSQADVNARGNSEAILANAAARGVAGGGLEMAQRMANQQNAAQMGSQRGFDEAALAEQRRMEALRGLGQVSSQVRGQDFSNAAQTASAQDAINRFNTRNKQNVENFNVGTSNQAQASNLAEKQRTADTNTNIANSQQQYNKQLLAQKFGMDMTKANAVASAKRADNAATWGNIGQVAGAAGSAFGGVGKMMQGGYGPASDMQVKENVSEFNPSEFLDELVPLRYNYTDDRYGQGEQAGVSAQALERVAPQAVSKDGEGIRRVDPAQLTMPLLAALADLSGRVGQLEGGR